MNTKVVFSTTIASFGTIDLRPLDIENDIDILHHWVNQEYAQYWGMLGKTLGQVRTEYEKIITHSDVFIGMVNGSISFLLERYNPKEDLIGNYYKVKKHDCGIHIIVAPAENPVHQFTWHIFSTILKFVFSDLTVQRIIVEPDIRNKKMFAICHRIGFEDADVVTLPHKTAQLAFCTRNQFISKMNHYILSKNNMNPDNQIQNPQQAITHIQPEIWAKANRHLVRKALCEFSHELLLKPKEVSNNNNWKHYSLVSDDKTIEYQFKAQLLALNHWHIETSSITKIKNNAVLPLDAVLFIKEFQETVGISKEILPSYIEEITSTLYGSAYKLLKNNPTARQLATADFQTIEQTMTEGHPGFVANNGRIGFNTMDYINYTPETGNPFKMLWLAGHKDRTVYAGTKALPYDTLIRQELDADTIGFFNTILMERGFSPDEYYFIPVHPWQWFNKLANLFSPELASGKLLCLGYGPDLYQAQQSIRTLFNTSHPTKHYTKTSLSILNMGFMRGLPVYYLGSAPEMAEWLENLLSDDAYLQKTGFAMLDEVASVSYINPYFEEFGKHNPYNKMLASLWRESPVSFISKKERLLTMAALLHIDSEGNALLPEIIKASNLSIDNWLQHYLQTYLGPLLHCFYQYDLVFMPHGENIILALEDHIPVKSFMKDITEEAVILNPEIELPENISRMYADVPEDVKLLSIFIDVFDGFFRFLSHILVEHAQYPEEHFWKCVAECINGYQEEHPHLEDKFERYDLFTSEFQLSCLNRLQINNNKTMIDLDDPVALLQFQGKLQNPIASFKRITA